MGKSTSAEVLRGLGVPVVDSDDLAREVVRPGQPALREIEQQFGHDVITSEGALDRQKLAAVVFADAARRTALEAILHPRIREFWEQQLALWKSEGKACGLIVIPLLFEIDAAAEFDRVICVACRAESQRERLLGRGWSMEEVERRISAQWPAEKKLTLSHHVVWTEGEPALHELQLVQIFNSLGIHLPKIN